MQSTDYNAEFGTAEWFRDNGRRVREAMAAKADAGEHNGPLPLGYKFEQAGLKRKAVLDPEKAPLVRQAFLMAAAGYPVRKVIAEVTAAGLVSRHGKPLGPSSMLKVMRNPFYAGLAGNDSYPPLVDDRTFRLTQRNLERKCRNPRDLASRIATPQER